jgi:hypothetical protein
LLNTYKGKRTEAGCIVTVNDRPLNPRFDLANKSPTGFEWGYEGSGPAQLALAMLAYELGSPVALRWFQDFKRAHISGLMTNEWEIDGKTIRAWFHDARNAGAK